MEEIGIRVPLPGEGEAVVVVEIGEVRFARLWKIGAAACWIPVCGEVGAAALIAEKVLSVTYSAGK